MHAALGGRDVGEHGVVERAVLVDLSGVAADRHAERHSRYRGHEVLDRLARFELQVRVLVALDRPDREAEHCDRDKQRDVDPGHTGDASLPVAATGRMAHGEIAPGRQNGG
jgi:hypothetical protein